MAAHPQTKSSPGLNLPQGNDVCDVSIINSTCDIVVPPSTLIEPQIEGHEYLNLPTYAFHIKTRRTGEQVLFDMGSRTDWQNLVPSVVDTLSHRIPGLKIEREVPDIIQAGGINLNDIKALILSHWHYDHCGNFRRLPTSTDIIVGPGFKKAFEPGWPSNPSSVFHEADFAGRTIIEPPFSENLKIGAYQAHDYFSDGSLYVLNVPGHTTGHISALVRTTPETFLFLGGDVCHFTGVIRPSAQIPMPDPYLPSSTILDSRLPSPCPCSIFTACHPNPTSPLNTPFYRCSTGGPYGSWYDDPPTAMQSINALMAFDADPNVLVIIAHDPAPKDSLTFFPHGTINDWKEKGVKEVMHWNFVNELPVDGKPGRKPLVDGLYRYERDDLKRVKALEDFGK